MDKIPDPRALFDVSGKVALITGATGALGEASAKGLAKAGVKVMLTARTEAKLAELEQELSLLLVLGLRVQTFFSCLLFPCISASILFLRGYSGKRGCLQYCEDRQNLPCIPTERICSVRQTGSQTVDF